jgi:hypothetical protein
MKLKLQLLSLALLVAGTACDSTAPPADPGPEPVPQTSELKMSDGVKVSTTTAAMPGQEGPRPK